MPSCDFPGLSSISNKWGKARRGNILGQGTCLGTEKNFSRNSSTEMRDKTRLKIGLSHQGESSSSKGIHDRDSEPRVKRNNEVDTPQERPPCRKCGKLHGGEYMMGSNACYSCGKPSHMRNDCPNRIGQEKGKEKLQPNSPSEEAPRRQ